MPAFALRNPILLGEVDWSENGAYPCALRPQSFRAHRIERCDTAHKEEEDKNGEDVNPAQHESPFRKTPRGGGAGVALSCAHLERSALAFEESKALLGDFCES